MMRSSVKLAYPINYFNRETAYNLKGIEEYEFAISSVYAQNCKLIRDKKIDDTHNYVHLNVVMELALKACRELGLSAYDTMCVLQADELHEADDRKYAREGEDIKNYGCARKILTEAGFDEETMEYIIKMISLVSCSTNKDNIPAGIEAHMLIPRHCDRFEGSCLIRFANFNIERNKPVYLEGKDRMPDYINKSSIEIKRTYLYDNIATQKRYDDYEHSASLICHLLDKIIHILKFDTGIRCIEDAKAKRQDKLEQVYFEYSESGTMTFERIGEIARL
jgi:hypothetical protein